MVLEENRRLMELADNPDHLLEAYTCNQDEQIGFLHPPLRDYDLINRGKSQQPDYLSLGSTA
jgi:hypothetical protein